MTKSERMVQDLFDMEGKTYGNWLVKKYIGKDKHSHHKLLCECLCDKKTIREINKNDIINKKSKSCGMCSTVELLIGDTFGRWTIVGKIDKQKVLCLCSCEYGTQSMVDVNSLRTKQSNGCIMCKIKYYEVGEIVESWKIIEGIKWRNGMLKYLCECQDGSKEIKELSGNELKYKSMIGCSTNKIERNTYIEYDDYMLGIDYKGSEFYFDIEDYAKIKPYTWNVGECSKTKGDFAYVTGTVNGEREYECIDL